MRHISLFLFLFAAVFVGAEPGKTAVLNGNNGKQQQPMFTSEEIARSAIRRKAQEDILSRSRLDRGKSPGSPQSPLSGSSGIGSPGAPGAPGSRFSPDLSASRQSSSARRPSTYLQDPPVPRGGVNKANTVSSSSSDRKPSCASLCQTVYEQPARPTCIFDSLLNDFVSLRNTAHIACYKCLNPNSRIDVRTNQSDCDGHNARNKRNIGQ